MNNRITPELITELSELEIFVFGSNLGGRHGKGAAKQALTWGAKYGQGVGQQGRTYGIPTKDHNFHVLPLNKIQKYVDEFIRWTQLGFYTSCRFLVTKIGCGLAGYKPKDIAPLFVAAKDLPNVYLPQRFWRIIENI